MLTPCSWRMRSSSASTLAHTAGWATSAAPLVSGRGTAADAGRMAGRLGMRGQGWEQCRRACECCQHCGFRGACPWLPALSLPLTELPACLPACPPACLPAVYGDYQGDWVDEGSELRAAGGKGWARVVAEHEWLSLQDAFGLPVHIFRCGGIYGEGWLPPCAVGWGVLPLAAGSR